MVLVDRSNAWMRFIYCTAFRIVSAASNDICKYFLELSASMYAFIHLYSSYPLEMMPMLKQATKNLVATLPSWCTYWAM